VNDSVARRSSRSGCRCGRRGSPPPRRSSLEAFHAIEALVTVEPVTTTPVGVLGAVLSARVLV